MSTTPDGKKPCDLWVVEDQQGILELHYRVNRTLFSADAATQHIDIVETAGFGRMLLNDGLVMLSERDEFVYHEMIVHVPAFVHPGVERALVIGGGDGGTVRELLRHESLSHCRLVEIEPIVVDACKKHIPQTAAALDDPRVEVTIRDGVEYVASTDERYDLIIVDSTDPVGPGAPLFGAEFYSNVQRLLTDEGIVVSQAESPFYFGDHQAELLRILRASFRRVQLYNYHNLVYPGGIWSFSLASKGDRCPVGDFDPRRVEASGLEFEYYSPAVHRAAFVHPAFQVRLTGEYLTPLKKSAFAD